MYMRPPTERKKAANRQQNRRARPLKTIKAPASRWFNCFGQTGAPQKGEIVQTADARE
jgi:hypothetical protein